MLIIHIIQLFYVESYLRNGIIVKFLIIISYKIIVRLLHITKRTYFLSLLQFML